MGRLSPFFLQRWMRFGGGTTLIRQLHINRIDDYVASEYHVFRCFIIGPLMLLNDVLTSFFSPIPHWFCVCIVFNIEPKPDQRWITFTSLKKNNNKIRGKNAGCERHICLELLCLGYFCFVRILSGKSWSVNVQTLGMVKKKKKKRRNCLL